MSLPMSLPLKKCPTEKMMTSEQAGADKGLCD